MYVCYVFIAILILTGDWFWATKDPNKESDNQNDSSLSCGDHDLYQIVPAVHLFDVEM